VIPPTANPCAFWPFRSSNSYSDCGTTPQIQSRLSQPMVSQLPWRLIEQAASGGAVA
jgi:hypothetical protein